MMEAARTSETLVNFYQTTRCYNPEDSNLHTHCRENLKSYRGLTGRVTLLFRRNQKTSERGPVFDRRFLPWVKIIFESVIHKTTKVTFEKTRKKKRRRNMVENTLLILHTIYFSPRIIDKYLIFWYSYSSPTSFVCRVIRWSYFWTHEYSSTWWWRQQAPLKRR
jgi:hypothetical protein